MKKVLFYGDSNTYGFDPRGMMGGRFPESERWTEILASKMYGEWRIFSDGMNGRVIPDNPYSLLSLDKSVLEYSPLDLFAVMLGTNDLINMSVPDAEAVSSKMRDFIERQLNRTEFIDNRTGFLLISPPRILPHMDENLEEAEAQRKRFSSELDIIAQEFGIFFADASEWDLDMSFDGVHLSAQGHQEFAAKMADILQGIDLTAERQEVDDYVCVHLA
ncbi:GDSL-type esterase/lipase family protein [Butyrivibrio sp. WCE2006]|uniref:GDSL-type esterase/lipase family protein n=1 Tax=Butyrivibrio sp. WCE2006 TaxID=1410611 RepID=UPI0005D1ACC3|nr:GDSL-type esterase/lipase family protein [Butyrivibrio sp. WCE2006]